MLGLRVGPAHADGHVRLALGRGVDGELGRRYHKALAQKISQKSGERYEDITRLIRVKISFLVLRASLLCLRGSRTLSNNNNAENCEDYALTLHEIGMR